MATTGYPHVSAAAGSSGVRFAAGEPCLRLDAVSRRFGDLLALAPVSLRLGRGSVTLVTGANGSGKTTLLRLTAGALQPSTGIRAASGPAVFLRSGDGARRQETALEAVGFVAGLRGDSSDAPEALLAWAGVERQALHRPAGLLSAGQRARLTLAVALAARAHVVCLDEPTAHVDEDGRAVAAATVRRLADEGAAVLLASHDPEHWEAMVDGALHLRQGRLQPVSS